MCDEISVLTFVISWITVSHLISSHLIYCQLISSHLKAAASLVISSQLKAALPLWGGEKKNLHCYHLMDYGTGISFNLIVCQLHLLSSHRPPSLWGGREKFSIVMTKIISFSKSHRISIWRISLSPPQRGRAALSCDVMS